MQLTAGGKPPPPTEKERENIEMLAMVMDGAIDESHALVLLRKYNNDLDKAATALLEGETGADALDAFADLPALEAIDAPGPGPRTPPPSRPENPVIDLTGDDDPALARALAESLEYNDGGSATTFGPSTRAPDANWAMVSSNAQIGPPQEGMSQDDQAMSRAIEASLSYNIGEDVYFEAPLEERVRVGDTPVALRPTLSGMTYAALILHGLFHVPQVKQAIANWLPIPVDGATGVSDIPDGTGRQTWGLVELFCNMDIARLSDLNVDEALKAFTTMPWGSPADRPVDVSTRFYEKVAYVVENVLQYNNAYNPERLPRRLMSLQHGYHDSTSDNSSTDSLCCVKVNVGTTPDTNDLVSSLAAELTPSFSDRRRQVIYEPSEVIAFQLYRGAEQLPSYDAPMGRRTERETFKYPKSIYLDQFMHESYDLASSKRQEQKRLLAEVRALEDRKKNLLHFNDKDTLADLRSVLHYYENIADNDGSPKRVEELRVLKEKISGIIDKIQEEAKLIDVNIERMRTEAQSLLDCPELQKHQYDLRAVLVHDGLFGRSHLYSYIKQKGQWWKTVDYKVTQASEETVLTDPTGLHLGAGPYFLIYSRAIPWEDEDMRSSWPEDVKDTVKHNNRTFFSQLPQDVRERAVDTNSPPASPSIATPSEMTISSDVAEPPESRDEMMDLSD